MDEQVHAISRCMRGALTVFDVGAGLAMAWYFGRRRPDLAAAGAVFAVTAAVGGVMWTGLAPPAMEVDFTPQVVPVAMGARW